MVGIVVIKNIMVNDMFIVGCDYKSREFKESNYVVYSGICLINTIVYQISKIYERIDCFYNGQEFGREYLVKLKPELSFSIDHEEKLVTNDQLSYYKLLTLEEVERIKKMIKEFEKLRNY